MTDNLAEATSQRDARSGVTAVTVTAVPISPKPLPAFTVNPVGTSARAALFSLIRSLPKRIRKQMRQPGTADWKSRTALPTAHGSANEKARLGSQGGPEIRGCKSPVLPN
jgi:hypothetical protein